MVVAPANWDVYPHKLPRGPSGCGAAPVLQTLMREHPDLPWIDTRSALREAARTNPTYEPLNSHWTPYGGYVAWKAIARCLRVTTPGAGSPNRRPPITGVGVAAGPNEFGYYGVPDGRRGAPYPLYAAEHPATTITHLPDGARSRTAPTTSPTCSRLR